MACWALRRCGEDVAYPRGGAAAGRLGRCGAAAYFRIVRSSFNENERPGSVADLWTCIHLFKGILGFENRSSYTFTSLNIHSNPRSLEKSKIKEEEEACRSRKIKIHHATARSLVFLSFTLSFLSFLEIMMYSITLGLFVYFIMN